MNNELKHVGVLGMKWGKRKAINKDRIDEKTIRKGKKIVLGILIGGVGVLLVQPLMKKTIAPKLGEIVSNQFNKKMGIVKPIYDLGVNPYYKKHD